jgi:hypothetical protein
VIAEKFQPLITTGAVSGAAKRRNVRQRNFELGRISEVIADTLFENCCSALAAREVGVADAAIAAGAAESSAAVSRIVGDLRLRRPLIVPV